MTQRIFKGTRLDLIRKTQRNHPGLIVIVTPFCSAKNETVLGVRLPSLAVCIFLCITL